MRFKAILAEAARKRYPLSILLIVVGILTTPFPWLFIHFGLELTGAWWSALGIAVGIVVGCALIGLGSVVEDVHDVSMHTMGYDLEIGELEIEEEDAEDIEAIQNDASANEGSEQDA